MRDIYATVWSNENLDEPRRNLGVLNANIRSQVCKSYIYSGLHGR